MFQRSFSFLVFGVLLLALLLTGSQQNSIISPKETLTASVSESDEQVTARRRKLLESLDRIVAYEHYFHSVFGKFTQDLSKTGLPPTVIQADPYWIRIEEASSDRFLVVANPVSSSKIGDRISIDQDYRLSSNFEIPAPRLSYLKAKAMKHLRMLRELPPGQILEEQSIFRGYYKYVVREGSPRSVFAVGVRAPVAGMHVDLSSEMATGQKAGSETLSEPDRSSLAQAIFHGEIGHYAKSWDELGSIAEFDLDDPAPTALVEVNVGSAVRDPAAETSTANKVTSSNDLVIEPIDPSGSGNSGKP